MPLHHGYRERIPANIYDAFRPRDLRDCSSRKLFGNAYIGNSMFTNMSMPYSLPADQTAIIINWYARTNMTVAPEFKAAWDAWTHATVATLVIGSMPVHNLPLSDLLQRKEGQGLGTDLSDTAHGALARRLFCQFEAGTPDSAAGQADWELMSSTTKGKWLMVASEAMGTLTMPLLAIIPTRQSFNVMLNTNTQALGAMLETMPTDTAPEALVWIHLEGQLSRLINL